MLLCLALCEGHVFHAAVNGSDLNTGRTVEDPLETLCACVEALKEAGDECHLHAGTYEVGEQTCSMIGLKGTATDRVVVKAAGDGPVLVDGTLAVEGPWRKSASGSFYAAKAPAPVLHTGTRS